MIYACYKDYGYEGKSEPCAVFSKEQDAVRWAKLQMGDRAVYVALKLDEQVELLGARERVIDLEAALGGCEVMKSPRQWAEIINSTCGSDSICMHGEGSKTYGYLNLDETEKVIRRVQEEALEEADEAVRSRGFLTDAIRSLKNKES